MGVEARFGGGSGGSELIERERERERECLCVCEDMEWREK